MARTRNSSRSFMDDGRVALDRQGNPISPAAFELQARTPLSMDGAYVPRGPAPQPEPKPRAPVAYRADRSSWTRSMDAYTLACMIDMALKGDPAELGDGLVVTVTPEEFARLSGDMRLHFKAVYE
jgi:hypothetical protein